MPKVSKIQPGFTTGEISRQAYGRVDTPKYELGLAYCQNYLPIQQGPLIRRPGTRFLNYVKDSTKPPVLLPFQIASNQNYMLELGEKYIRFYQNEGQIVTNSNVFVVTGQHAQAGNTNNAGYKLYSVRTTTSPQPGERLLTSSTVSSGSILEMPTPYEWADIKQIKWAQKYDTLYLTHPNYPTMKLQRVGQYYWDLKMVLFQDGPFLPLNTYQTLADNANTGISVTNVVGLHGSIVDGSTQIKCETYPKYRIYDMGQNAQTGSTGLLVTVFGSCAFQVGDRVFISQVVGSSNVNNIRSPGSTECFVNSAVIDAYWVVGAITPSLGGGGGDIIYLAGPKDVQFQNYVGSGFIQPALLQLIQNSSGVGWADIQTGSTSPGYKDLRTIGLVQTSDASRHWGYITAIDSAAEFYVDMGSGQAMKNGSSSIWQLGVYNRANGYPAAACFHQDRLVLAGCPAYPQQVDASMTSLYEVFSASGSTFQVAANNALQFGLNSQEVNSIKWLKSNSQGLIAGAIGGEWAIAPNTQGGALSPTNISANQVTAFGCADADAVLVGNAAVYIQRAQRKVRELLYYWQVGNFRSTNLSELAQHMTIPSVTRLTHQREPHAIIWGLKGDGNLLALTYNRDDATLQANAGWSRHVLGGRSDAAGSPPVVNSIGVIPSSDGTYDQMWLVTQRYMNGSSLACIEYMSKPFDDNTAQERAYHFDCGASYNSSILVSGMSVGGSCVITANNHGLANSSIVRFYNVVGMNITSTDINGVVQSSNPFNNQTFVVQSVSTNAFFVQDFLGNYINTNSCSVYVGSAVVSQLVTNVSGLSWLAGEEVSILADGAICANTTVSQAGVLTLPNNQKASYISVGYSYNSDGEMLRTHEGSAQGTSIGATRRVNRVAFMLHQVGDFSFGESFASLTPCEFMRADAMNADQPVPLFSGVHREQFPGSYGFTDRVCFRQNSGLPGMVQAVTRFLEEQDI